MSNLQDRIASMVHAFGDTTRKDAVRALARDVGAMEASVAELEARCKRLEEIGDMIVDEYMVERAEKDAWEQAKEAKP